MPSVCKCLRAAVTVGWVRPRSAAAVGDSQRQPLLKDNHLSFNNRRDYERMLPAPEHHKTKAFPRVRHVSIRGMEKKAILHNDPNSPSDQRVDAFSALC
jgi:hypothetical protein